MCPFGNILFGNVFKMFLTIFSFKLSKQNDFFQGHRGAERAWQQSTAAASSATTKVVNVVSVGGEPLSLWETFLLSAKKRLALSASVYQYCYTILSAATFDR